MLILPGYLYDVCFDVFFDLRLNKSRPLWRHCNHMRYTEHWFTNAPFTQGLWPLCLPCATTKLDRSALKAQRRQKGCLGRSGVAQRTPWSPWSFEHVQNSRTKSPRRLVAHRSLKGGKRKAHASPWSQNGCTGLGHWSTRKKMRTVVNILYQLERCLCLSCATIVPPLTPQ